MKSFDSKYFIVWMTVLMTFMPCHAASYSPAQIAQIAQEIGATASQMANLFAQSGCASTDPVCAIRWLEAQQNQLEGALVGMTSQNAASVLALFTPMFELAGIDQTTCGVFSYPENSLSLTICSNYMRFKNKLASLLA